MTNQPARSCRLLVADDNRDAADTLARLLEAVVGCDATTAYDGRQAVIEALAHRPDAVVLDLNMPAMDGLAAARAVRSAFPTDPPLLVLLTGEDDVAADLGAIHELFDHAFAKPPDLPRLTALLSRHLQNRSTDTSTPADFDFGELFTAEARQIVPLVVAKKLALSFDYRGPALRIEDDPVALQCGLHRLACGAIDVLEAGFVIFRADVEPLDASRCRLVLTAAGTGPLAPQERITEVLERLQLVEDASTDGDARRRARAGRGWCPNTGGRIEFACSPTEGVLFRTELLRPVVGAVDDGMVPDAESARAWLVDADEVGSAWLTRRLQRLGWAMTRFASCAEASALLRDSARRERHPSLLIVLEGPHNSLAQAQALRGLLDAETQVVLAVMAGSPTLRVPRPEATAEDTRPLDIRVHPLSPGELADFTRRLEAGAPRSSGETQPAALTQANRPKVLVVDDNEVNRVVAQGLLEALGYRVDTATNGLDAIELCRAEPPEVVLMDLDMPVLGGIEATRRIRELQRAGAIVPFGVVAATADVSLGTRRACIEAGMDGYLSKPLSLMLLRAELQRVALPHWQRY